jgi:hypothetical protein
MIDAKEFFQSKTLSAGSHGGDRTSPSCAMCAREALAFLATGEAYDRTPDGYPSWWAALPPINDALADEDRQVVLRPRLWRYAVKAEPARDRRIVRKLVTLAVTRFAADACERIGLHEHARLLRAIDAAGRRTEASDACASAADACAAAACASAASASAAAACASAADTCAGAAAACERAANAAYHLHQRTSAYSQTVQCHDRLAEAATWSAFAAAYSAAASLKRRIEYVELLLNAIDEELPAQTTQSEPATA